MDRKEILKQELLDIAHDVYEIGSQFNLLNFLADLSEVVSDIVRENN